MSNIDKRAQKELYAKVEQQAHSLRGNSREYQELTGMCPVNVIEMLAQKILALLDELEAKDKSISFLKDQLAQLANFNPDWDKLEAATDSLREHIAELTAARKRIADLEAVKCKLSDSKLLSLAKDIVENLVDTGSSEPEYTQQYVDWTCKRIRAAGINGEG